MKVLLFGATGMVGQGVLRECLLADDVTSVVTVGRTRVQADHPKLRQIVHEDLYDYRAVESELTPFDACFFCLGTSSAGKTEAQYRRVTFDLTMAVASTLARLNPSMVFVYGSGAGADSSGAGPVMWAKVRGQTENALQKLPFRAVYAFRPGVIQPLHGATSKTRAYRVFYSLTRPLLPIVRKLFPKFVLTTVTIGQAMLNTVRYGAPKTVLEAADIQERSQPPRVG
ncbi:MAG: NAD-dependent epimerase/dehydratase family protein [Gammaproteobacteria bacterium]